VTRLGEIAAEMCLLLDQQAALLKTEVKLRDMSEAELARYSERNDRLNRLCKELTALV
jgi:hypothetical protein